MKEVSSREKDSLFTRCCLLRLKEGFDFKIATFIHLFCRVVKCVLHLPSHIWIGCFVMKSLSLFHTAELCQRTRNVFSFWLPHFVDPYRLYNYSLEGLWSGGRGWIYFGGGWRASDWRRECLGHAKLLGQHLLLGHVLQLLQHENKRNCGMVVIHTTYIICINNLVHGSQGGFSIHPGTVPISRFRPKEEWFAYFYSVPQNGTEGLSRQISTISRGLSDPMPCSLSLSPSAEWGSLPPLILSKKVETVHRQFTSTEMMS